MKIVIALMQTKIVFLCQVVLNLFEDERFDKPRQEFDATFYFSEKKYDMKLGN